MLTYFVFPNGTALASNEVEKMLSDPEHFPILGEFGLVYVVSILLSESSSVLNLSLTSFIT